MVSLSFETTFSAYIAVASLTILVWDILNNVKNDYHLLFRQRLGLPTVAYFLSRLSALCWTIIKVIYPHIPSMHCTALETASAVLLIVGMTSTKFLCYLRVCAVWRWNYLLVCFFTVSWLAVAAASSLAAILSTKSLQVESYCTVIIVEARFIPAPFIVAVINHTLIVMGITYGVCKNTLGGELTFRHGIMLMLGKSLPTFSKAMLHDSQITYIMIMGISIITLIWVNNWPDHQPTSAFRIAPIAPYFALVAILTSRVHRNTKLGLYNTVSLQSNDRKTQPHAAAYSMVQGKSQKPIQIEVTTSNGDHDGYSTDYSTRSRGSVRGSASFLDFGMV